MAINRIVVGNEYIVGRLSDGRPAVRTAVRTIQNGEVMIDFDGIQYHISGLKCCPPSYRLRKKSTFVIKKPENLWNFNRTIEWANAMNSYDGKVIKLRDAIIEYDYVIYGPWHFSRDWLIPA